MKKNRIRIAFMGSGGDGVMSVAAMVMRSAADYGLYGLMAQSYGPQIRGGETAAYLNISEEPVTAENYTKDLIICYSFSHAKRFRRDLKLAPHTLLLYEESDKTPMPEWFKENIKHVNAIPFNKLLTESKLPSLSKNVFTFGMLTRIFNWDLKKGARFVEQHFLKKGPTVVNTNQKAFKLGYIFGEKLSFPFEFQLESSDKELHSITGNVACSQAALAAGCRFFAGYPITPSSEVLSTLIKLMPTKGGKLIQAEDEIASLGMCIGASYGGVPSMTATSGPGLSLMTEMMGLSSMAEIPLVILNVQRGGPSTGIPSKTEQSDLFHAVYGGHGDFPRVVTAIKNVEDCWQSMFRAFYIAEKYHLPVIVLSDGYIGQRAENISKKIDKDLFPQPQRFKIEAMPQEGENILDLYPDLPKGVSPKVEPGDSSEVFHHVAGIEVDEQGRPSATREVHEQMSHRRLSKMTSIEKEIEDWFEEGGNKKAKVGLVAWGSTRGAVHQLVEEQKDIKYFIPEIIHPFPIRAFQRFVDSVDKLCFVELNFYGQLYKHIRTIMDLPNDTINLNVGGGSPISPLELETLLKDTAIGEVIK